MRRNKVIKGSSVTMIRYLVAYVFMLVGLLKWVSDDYGLTRFIQIGIPFPDVSVLIIGSIEMICGSLLLFDLHVNKATIPLLGVMVGAIFTTKIPILLKSGLGPFAFESRLDIVMIILLVILWKEHHNVLKTT